MTLGYSLYFFGISMFSWMSVLCFDLYFTFTKTTSHQSKKHLGRLVVYTSFSFGLPLVACIAVALVSDLILKMSGVQRKWNKVNRLSAPLLGRFRMKKNPLSYVFGKTKISSSGLAQRRIKKL